MKTLPIFLCLLIHSDLNFFLQCASLLLFLVAFHVVTYPLIKEYNYRFFHQFDDEEYEE